VLTSLQIWLLLSKEDGFIITGVHDLILIHCTAYWIGLGAKEHGAMVCIICLPIVPKVSPLNMAIALPAAPDNILRAILSTAVRIIKADSSGCCHVLDISSKTLPNTLVCSATSPPEALSGL
jgi:hypothetical protein